jgi:hypothetical protein
MSRTDPSRLARLLRQRVLRARTGIVLLPLDMLGHEPELAARLDIGTVDWREWKLNRLRSDSRYLGLSSEIVLRDLQNIVEDVDLIGNCLWIYNADLLLAALRYDERLRFWTFLHSTFKPHRGLLFSLSTQASNLLPMEERKTWEKDERLAIWEGA